MKICSRCKEEKELTDFHHIIAETKDFNVSTIVGYKWSTVLTEIDKCVIVCKNCHAKTHAGLITISS